MKRFIALFLCLIIVCIPAASFAHSGGTDANGGHYDSDTGEYHYHHGYPAHKHPNGVCPYSESVGSTDIIPDETFEDIFHEGYYEGYYDAYDELESAAASKYDEGYETGYDEGYKKAEPLVPSWCLTVMFFLVVAIVELIRRLRRAQ